eukprot:CAMPEP_0175001546 /NCGR_PEP_ID=MMETSP0005-20121125/3191_1 /TAXON_ID=420556 /ORGANISM="Ochromonas sp., Strain CCMP1393" /LENGTH=122 /DNA_ID=CAMNT_0016256439 /DNA_START=94 /DNA_END=462 /DNA_ORIENTATION=-
MTRAYSDPEQYALCVLCRTNYADQVFFPCEHRCVCGDCVKREQICSDSQLEQLPHGIKLILPSEGGLEVEKYWNWVYEEPVPLPPRFIRDWRHSAAVIRAVHARLNPSQDSFEKAVEKCIVS